MTLPTLNLHELGLLATAEALHQTNGRVRAAAKILGIGSATLYRRLSDADLQAAVRDRATLVPDEPTVPHE